MNSDNDKEMKEIYEYLTKYNENDANKNTKNYDDIFCYYSELKDIIEDYEKRFNKKKPQNNNN